MVCNDPLNLLYYWFIPQRLGVHCHWRLAAQMVSGEIGLAQYLVPFLFTLLLESIFYFLLLKKYSYRKRVFWLLIANLATHPLVYLAFPRVFGAFTLSYASYLTFSELFAPALEVLILWRFAKAGLPRAVLLIVWANLFSWWVGSSLQVG